MCDRTSVCWSESAVVPFSTALRKSLGARIPPHADETANIWAVGASRGRRDGDNRAATINYSLLPGLKRKRKKRAISISHRSKRRCSIARFFLTKQRTIQTYLIWRDIKHHWFMNALKDKLIIFAAVSQMSIYPLTVSAIRLYIHAVFMWWLVCHCVRMFVRVCVSKQLRQVSVWNMRENG